MYIAAPVWARRCPPPAAQVTEHTVPTGQKPVPPAQDCTALASLTLGISFGQPRVFFETWGQVREAALTACIMLADCSWVLQYLLNGVSTLAHSVSHDVGKPLEQSVSAFAQHAELTSAVQAGHQHRSQPYARFRSEANALCAPWNDSGWSHLSGAPACSCRPTVGMAFASPLNASIATPRIAIMPHTTALPASAAPSAPPQQRPQPRQQLLRTLPSPAHRLWSPVSEESHGIWEDPIQIFIP